MTRLRDSSFVLPADNDQRAQTQAGRRDPNNSSLTLFRQDHEASDINITEGQLNGIRSLIQKSFASTSRGIAHKAALAAVQALQASNAASNRPKPVADPPIATPQDHAQIGACRNGSPFKDIPATYVKNIQSGEFFEFSKLLPKNLSTMEKEGNLELILDNSVVQVSKKSKTATTIPDIAQWTTAFTTYITFFTPAFSGVASVPQPDLMCRPGKHRLGMGNIWLQVSPTDQPRQILCLVGY